MTAVRKYALPQKDVAPKVRIAGPNQLLAVSVSVSSCLCACWVHVPVCACVRVGRRRVCVCVPGERAFCSALAYVVDGVRACVSVRCARSLTRRGRQGWWGAAGTLETTGTSSHAGGRDVTRLSWESATTGTSPTQPEYIRHRVTVAPESR